MKLTAPEGLMPTKPLKVLVFLNEKMFAVVPQDLMAGQLVSLRHQLLFERETYYENRLAYTAVLEIVMAKGESA